MLRAALRHMAMGGSVNAQQQSAEGRLSSRSHRTTAKDAEDRHTQGRRLADALHQRTKSRSAERSRHAFVRGRLTAMGCHRPGHASSLALAEPPGIFLCRLFPYSAGHMPGRANSLALAKADIVLTCKFFPVLPSICYLSSLIQCPACLARVVVFDNKIL